VGHYLGKFFHVLAMGGNSRSRMGVRDRGERFAFYCNVTLMGATPTPLLFNDFRGEHSSSFHRDWTGGI
jgi:hypothetical protein